MRDRLTRRQVIGVLGGALVATGGMMQAPAASAARSWCRADPILSIGGHEAHINLYSWSEMFAAATGPIQVIVSVPEGDEGVVELLYADNGFGHGYELTIHVSDLATERSAGIDIVVEALAPAADDTIPVQLELVPVTTGLPSKVHRGKANQWITMRGKI